MPKGKEGNDVSTKRSSLGTLKGEMTDQNIYMYIPYIQKAEVTRDGCDIVESDLGGKVVK